MPLLKVPFLTWTRVSKPRLKFLTNSQHLDVVSLGVHIIYHVCMRERVSVCGVGDAGK